MVSPYDTNYGHAMPNNWPGADGLNQADRQRLSGIRARYATQQPITMQQSQGTGTTPSPSDEWINSVLNNQNAPEWERHYAMMLKHGIQVPRSMLETWKKQYGDRRVYIPEVERSLTRGMQPTV